MSYDIYLNDAEGKHITFDETHGIAGGTQEVGGTRTAWLNITFNYGRHYYRLIEGGLPSIEGKTALETLPRLAAAASQLGADVSSDYWEPTEGNARAALFDLMRLAMLAPHGIWEVSK